MQMGPKRLLSEQASAIWPCTDRPRCKHRVTWGSILYGLLCPNIRNGAVIVAPAVWILPPMTVHWRSRTWVAWIQCDVKITSMLNCVYRVHKAVSITTRSATKKLEVGWIMFLQSLLEIQQPRIGKASVILLTPKINRFNWEIWTVLA